MIEVVKHFDCLRYASTIILDSANEMCNCNARTHLKPLCTQQASCGGRREVFWCDELQMMTKTTTTTTENEREMDLQRRTRPQDIALELQ
jgi:hypothetical protein